jgi:two-component system sensor histidine kinase SenX3
MTSESPEYLSEDLDFLRQLLRDLSHEIAAPLTPLFGHLDLLELRTEDKLSPMQMRCMRAMRRSLRRLSAINDRMLEMARVERGHIPCDLVPLIPYQAVAEVVRRKSSSAESHGVVLEQRSSISDDRKILADWNLLVIALGHLVENALRYAPDGTTVTLETGAEDDGCAIRVIDQGRAVPASELEKILRPFYRVTDAEGYTETAGLGLTIVDLIARRHSGCLRFSFTQPDRSEQPGLTAALVIPWSE